MNLETLTPAALFAVLLSIVLEWVPGVREWYEALTPARKTGINALGVFIISVVAMIGGRYWWGNVCPADWWAGLWDLALIFILSLAGNQAVYRSTRRELFSGRRVKSVPYS